MKITVARSTTIWIATLAGILSGLFSLIAAVIQSDFVQRGCHHMSSLDWDITANCTDAYNMGAITSGMALGCAAVALITFWQGSDD